MTVSQPDRLHSIARKGLFLLLLAAWIIPGLVGRDPWRADEAYTFGIVLNMVETGDWLVPTVAADPFMEKPPVFYITSAVLAEVFSPLLPLHDAARAACLFYLVLTMAFVGLASHELNGRGTGWLAAVVLLGIPGYIHYAHMLMTDNSLLTGFALALYGLALGLRKPWVGGMVCGTGCGLAFLSKGLVGPGVIGLAVLGLPLCSPAWRNRNYLRLLGGIVVAALPWVTIWPLLLYQRSPELFMTWFWNNNIERFMGVGLGRTTTTPFHYVPSLIAFAFPAWVLVAWGLGREGRAGLRLEGVRLPLLLFGATFFVLSLAGQRRSNYALPLYAPLAVLAARYADRLGERPAQLLNRAALMVFSALALLVWFAWSAQFTGFPSLVMQRIHAELPTYKPHLPVAFLALAVLGTVGWGALLIRSSQQSRFVFVHWTAGVALLYLLGMTLWLPFADERNTERYALRGLREALGPNPGLVSCRGLGQPQRAMVHYFAGIRAACEEIRGPQNGDWVLVGSRDRQGELPHPPDPAWKLVWQGRHGPELFHLYEHVR